MFTPAVVVDTWLHVPPLVHWRLSVRVRPSRLGRGWPEPPPSLRTTEENNSAIVHYYTVRRADYQYMYTLCDLCKVWHGSQLWRRNKLTTSCNKLIDIVQFNDSHIVDLGNGIVLGVSDAVTVATSIRVAGALAGVRLYLLQVCPHLLLLQQDRTC